MSERPGITYMPVASTTWPRGVVRADDEATLTMRVPSTTTVSPRRSVPFETSTTVAFVIVRVCAETPLTQRRRRRSPASGRVTSAIHDGEIRAPRADGVAVLLGHHARGLRDVAEVVADPGREQLTERDRSEFRMLAGQRELRAGQLPAGERAEVAGAQLFEFVEQ